MVCREPSAAASFTDFPVKRAQALQDLSREHHEALVLARRACAAAADPHGLDAQAQRAHLLERWAVQFAPHFELEEQTLLPALERAGQHEPVATALAQHTCLRDLIERIRHGDVLALAPWGDSMEIHVRFEERNLFPLAQSVFEPSELTDVMKQSAPHPSSST
jgi:hemerythrin-like domain-containing protein